MRDLIKSDMLLALYKHWCACRDKRIVPFRSSIDLTQIPSIFSQLAIFEFLPAEEAYSCRLAGEVVQKAFKKSLSGKKVEQFFDTELSAIFNSYFDTIRIQTSVVVGTGHSQDNENVEILMLPLCNAEGEIVQILCAWMFDYDIEQSAFDFSADDFTFRSFDCRNLED